MEVLTARGCSESGDRVLNLADDDFTVFLGQSDHDVPDLQNESYLFQALCSCVRDCCHC